MKQPTNITTTATSDISDCVPVTAATDPSSTLSRRNFLALAGIAGTGMLFGLDLTGCSSDKGEGTASDTSSDIDYTDWDAVLAAAQGQTVSWYGWGGSAPRNAWIEGTLAPRLKEKFDITLELIGMDINDILTKLSGEMQAGITEGSIDFIWINGENFYSTKENGFLWGPFTSYLPNFTTYIDAESPEVTHDFGSLTDGFEAPYAKAQFHLWVDSAVVETPPTNPEEFLELCQAFPGRVTYPEPGDFQGTAFISSLIAGVIGKDAFEQLSVLPPGEGTAEVIKSIIEPGLAYLRSLNPYLWKQGTTFPADAATVANMFADGELILNMGYENPQASVDDGSLPKTVRSFIFETGTVGNSNFMAIAANAPHKPAALVVINEILSPEMQLSQYETLGNITVLDPTKLPIEMQAAFDAVPLKSAQISSSDFLAHRITEASGPAIPIIEDLWLSKVVGK